MADGILRPPPPSHPFRWIPEFLELGRQRFRTQGRMLGSSVVVGVVAGLAAVAFSIACDVVVQIALEGGAGYHAQAPDGEPKLPPLLELTTQFRPWLLILIPTIGGLISGFVVFRFAPEAEGHGTDAVIAAYHHHQGSIRPRVPVVKLIASAVTIGTGGSGGREGPIAQIGAGFGSLLANLLHLRPAERRILLAAGMGAGIAAIFRAPLAGALFAAEVLYRSPEFEPEVIIPAGIASVVSYCTFGAFFGFAPLFSTPPMTFVNPLQLGPYFLLAVLMAVLAMFHTRTFNGITYIFRRLGIPVYFKPAFGALLSGALAVGLFYVAAQNQQVLCVLSFGYGVLQEGLRHEASLSAVILIMIALGKVFTTALTIGSGGSGGVFGPSIVIGGCAGGAFGLFFHEFWPELVPHPASFMIMGMAGFFAAAAKTPFSTLLMVTEMTGGYELLLPALWVCAISFLLSDEQSLYTSQVENRARSPAHQGSFVRDVLRDISVRQFLTPANKVPLIHPYESLGSILDRLGESTFSVLPVVDDNSRLLGVVNIEEAHLASQAPHMSKLILAEDMMRTDIKPLRPEYSLDRAQELFIQNDLTALPVVKSRDDPTLVGMVRRSDVAMTYLRHVHGRRVGEAVAP